MTKETMKKLKRGDTVYVACKVDAVFINGGFIQVSTRDCNEGFDAYEDEVLEPSEDCVSREYILDKIHSENEMDKFENSNLFAVHYANLIINAPSVTPTRKAVKWAGDKAYPICPKCNCNIIEEYISCSDYAEMYKPMKYCPNCGERMEGENDSN